jgi:RNase H-fold protein (predicted Holliday junction resolvase)
VPQKTGYRVIGFDNASHNMGVAIFDNGKLVYYNLLTFNQGTATQRLNKIRDTLENQILPL